MKFVDGFFFKIGCEVVKEFFGIEFDEEFFDNICFKMIIDFDLYNDKVFVMFNLYGDIFFDMCVGFIGGFGFIFFGNIGDECFIFEVVYGFVFDIVGQGFVNFIVLFFSFIMMLRYMNFNFYADCIEKVIFDIFVEGKVFIGDFGGKVKIYEYVNVIIFKL